MHLSVPETDRSCISTPESGPESRFHTTHEFNAVPFAIRYSIVHAVSGFCALSPCNALLSVLGEWFGARLRVSISQCKIANK
jgi:hypothetical protein